MVLDTGDDGAFNNAFFGSSQYAIEQVAQAHGYHLLIANGGERALETVTELVLGKKVDGLILPPSAATPQVLARIGDFPHVILGQPDLCATIISRPLDCCAPRATGACACRRISALRPSTTPHWRSIWIRP